MRSAVTVSLVPEAKAGPFVYHDDLAGACAKAAALRYDAIELFAPGPDAVPETQLRGLLERHGLQLAAVGTGAGWLKHKLSLTSPDQSVRRGAVDFIKSMIEFGGRHQAPAIIGSMQGRWGEGISQPQALEWLMAGLNELGQYAATFGVPLLYEPLNRYETNLCTNIVAGVALMESLQTDNVRLLADLFHLHIEEVSVPAALEAGGKWIGHVHFVDSNRRPVGAGHMNYGPMIAALRKIGYTGYLSAEALPWPDSDAAAAQTIRGFRYWTGG